MLLQKAPVWGFEITRTLGFGLTLIVGVPPGIHASPKEDDVPEGYTEYLVMPVGRVSKITEIQGQPSKVDVGVWRYGKGTTDQTNFTMTMDCSKFR